jgi:tetratricopeptide (TPR) repeat protein
MELGRFEEALSAFEKAIQMRPGKGYLWRKKGHALKALLRKDEMNEAYDTGFRLDCPEYNI